jgi:hypothetical protein
VARIRIIDEWLRSPVSAPTHHRVVMVVADSWAEQRVLMRAFATARDQTRPTVMLHGVELAFGPAGPESHGAWGIHVEPPVDGRAQELRAQLELAARRLAGTRGNPPRLLDEPSRFEGRATGHWDPGAPPAQASARTGRDYYEPAEIAPPSVVPPAPWIATVQVAAVAAPVDAVSVAAHVRGPTAAANLAQPIANPAAAPARFDGSRTAPGYSTPDLFTLRPPRGRRTSFPPPAPFATAAAPTPLPAPAHAADGNLARLVGRTMPLGFRLDDGERAVLDALGRTSQLGASQIAALVGVADGVEWMERLLKKLGEHGLDLVVARPFAAPGEPLYALRR